MEGIKLKLEGTGLHGKNTKVWINGEEVTGKVQAVDVRWACDGVNVATIQFVVDDLDIASSVLVRKAEERTLEEVLSDLRAFTERQKRRNGW